MDGNQGYFFEDILDHMLEGCQVVGPDWRYLYLNDVAARHARREKGELLGRSMPEAFPGIENTPMFRALAACMNTRTPSRLSNEFVYPEGSSAWFELTFRPIAAGVLILSLEITESRRQQQQLARFFELSPDLMVIAGFDGSFRKVSPSWQNTLGFSSQELTGRPWLNFVHPEDQATTMEAGARLLAGEDVKLFLNRYRCRDGSYRLIEWHCTSAPREEAIYAVARDVSERHAAEETIRDLARFPSENPAPVMRIDDRGILLYANEASHRLLPDWCLAPGEKAPRPLQEAVAEARAQGAIRTLETAQGARIVSLSVVPVGEAGYANLYGRDITERKLAEDELRESASRLRRAEEIARLGHWRYDLRTGRIEWSDGMYRIFGVTREDFQPTLAGCTALIHPGDRSGIARAAAAMQQRGMASFEFRILGRDGEPTFAAGQGEVERDREGNVQALFGTLQDTTELRRKERELQDKNAEQESFANAISHDLKSPLVTVKTFLGYLERDMARGDAGRIEKDLFFMRTAADKMGLLLEELLELNRVGRIANPPQYVTFGELVEAALNLVAGPIAERGVKVRFTPAPLLLFVDRPRMVEVWQNLLENSIKFMGNQPSPVIEIGAEGTGRDALFFVRDNGIGIDPRFQPKVFGLFEKIDPKTPGTGIGLTLVKRVVEMHQGGIWVESAGNGQGACFRFTLPAAIRTAAKRPAEVPAS